ncbi:MAG: hypothetical protein K0R65_2413 [Crocinitomicaceae bacterium]|jgi:hypothetical protein|nr:hypothetical protein [Crocinitomicaceae bacterium]
MKNFTQTSLLLLLLTTVFQLNAQNWTGNVNSDWNNAANWSIAPGNGSSPVINPANYTGAMASPVLSSNSSFSPATIIVQNGAVLTLNANLTTQEDVEVIDAGSLIHITGGTFSVGPGNGGRLVADLGGAITVDGGNLVVDERLISGAAALITINDGNVTTNERLLLDLGGKIIQNGGTVEVGATFALADGEGAISCLYEMNAGTLNVTGEMALENEAGDFSPTFNMTGGTLNLDGDLIWFGEAPGTGTPRVHLSGGTANIDGLITNLAGSTVNMHLTVDGSATLNFSGASIDMIQITDSIIQRGTGAAIHLTNTSSWNNTGVFWAENTTTHFDGTTTLNGTGSYQFHSVIIHPLASLVHGNPAVISLSGDLMHGGNFVSNSNTVRLNGTDEQFLSGETIDFYTVTLENSSPEGVTLQTETHIFNELAFISGKINSNGAAFLVFEDNATSIGSSATRFVNGPVRKNGNDAFIFPIGKNDTWGRLGISGTASATNSFTAEYFDEAMIGASIVMPPLTAISPLEHWTFQRETGTTEEVNVALYWEDAAASGITNCDETTIASFDGGSWFNAVSTASGDCTGNGSGFLNSVATLSQYNAYTFGFLGEVTVVDTTVCAGGSYSIGTSTYTASGTYLDVLTSSQNTDSTVVTHLTVLDPIIATENVVLCFGDSVLVDGVYYQGAGTYPTFFTAANGCDSLLNTVVTVLPEINLNVLVSGTILTAENSAADNYQWIDCDNNQAVSGENDASFSPTENGSYAVIITSGDCSDTSECYTVNSVGLHSLEKTASFSVYPNPSGGTFNLLTKGLNNFKIQVTDLQGKLIYSRENCPAEMELSLGQSGIYFLEVESAEGRFVEKISVR